MPSTRRPPEVAPTRREVPVAGLLLDPLNPRLPEELQGADQGTLLRYLFDETVLDELIRSLSENGYFQHEPLIAYRDEDLDGWVVLEGNRRLAALKILLREPEATDQGLQPVLERPTPRASFSRKVQ
jgi:ParB-like chromosome segregation protein Spo0J